MFLVIKSIKIILLAFFISSQGVLTEQNAINITRAKVSFDFVSKDVQGSIAGFESESVYDAANPDQSVFKGSVAVETLETGNFLRDWSLKKSKYFNEEDFPRILFESKEIRRSTDGFEVVGDLTLKGVTKEVQIDFKEKKSQLIGSFSIYTSDYGISIKNKREDNLVKVEVSLAIGD